MSPSSSSSSISCLPFSYWQEWIQNANFDTDSPLYSDLLLQGVHAHDPAGSDCLSPTGCGLLDTKWHNTCTVRYSHTCNTWCGYLHTGCGHITVGCSIICAWHLLKYFPLRGNQEHGWNDTSCKFQNSLSSLTSGIRKVTMHPHNLQHFEGN